MICFPRCCKKTLKQFEESNNFGSLIRPRLTDAAEVLKTFELKKVPEELYINSIHQEVLKVLGFAEFLRQKYHVVITNPPYMGSANMNLMLRGFIKNNYSDSKSDLFSVFIERSLNLAIPSGTVAMITMQSWMFSLSL